MTETTDLDLTERASRLEGTYEHLATKADIAELRGEFKADIAALRGELKADIAELKGSLKMLLVAMTFILTLLNIGLKVFVP